MITIEAFPLSLRILMRLFVILPKWIIAYLVVITFVTAASLTVIEGVPGIGLVLLILLPIFGFCVALTLAIHPYLVGIRAGLDLLGEPYEDENLPLFRSALLISVIEALLAAMVSVVLLVGYQFMVGGTISLDLLGTLAATKDPSTVALQELRNLSWGYVTLASFLVAAVRLALRAALLPVMAMAAAGRAPRMMQSGHGRVFGSHFLGLFTLLLVTIATGHFLLTAVLSGFGHFGFVSFILGGLGDIAQRTLSGSALMFGWGLKQFFVILAGALLALWLFALECAGAAVAFQASNAAASPKPTEVIKQEHADIRALRHGRMG